MLGQALAPLEGRSWKNEKIPLLLGLPPLRPGQVPDLAKKVVDGFTREFKGPIDCPPVTPFALGHAGGILALEDACRRMARGEVQFCIVAGVDSYHDRETLEWLDAREQLKSERHTWGFIPGEAAAAFVLTTRKRATNNGWTVLGSLVGVGTSVPSTPASPCCSNSTPPRTSSRAAVSSQRSRFCR